MRIIQIQDELRKVGVDFEDSTTVKELRVIFRDWIYRNLNMEVVQIAESHGHEVLFSPPHHYDFQSIELIWAMIKGRLGRQYDMNTTFLIVKQRLKHEFSQLKTEDGKVSIKKCIEKSIRVIESFYRELEEQDDSESELENSSDSESDAQSVSEDDME